MSKEIDNVRYRVLVLGLLSTQLWLETMDELKDSKIYRHEVKRLMNTLENKMEKLLGPEFADIYTRDEESFRIFMEHLQKIMNWVVTAPFEDSVDLAKALESGQLKFENNERRR